MIAICEQTCSCGECSTKHPSNITINTFSWFNQKMNACERDDNCNGIAKWVHADDDDDDFII